MKPSFSFHELKITDEAILVEEVNDQTGEYRSRKINWQEICRVERICPDKLQLEAYRQNKTIHHPELEKQNPIPKGFEIENIKRRIVNKTPDILVQGLSGITLLIPLKKLEKKQQKTLFQFFRQKAPGKLWLPKCGILGKFMNLDEQYANLSNNYKRIQTVEQEATNLFTERQWKLSLEYFEAASNEWNQLGIIENAARCLHLIVPCLIHLGLYSRARNVLIKCLYLRRNLEQAYWVADCLMRWSEITWKIGQHYERDMAVQYLEIAYKIYKELGQNDTAALALGNQALFYLDDYVMSKSPPLLNKADQFITESLHLLEQISEVQSPHLQTHKANLLGTKAKVLFLKDQNRAAADLYQKAHHFGQSFKQGIVLEDKAYWGYTSFLASYPGQSSEDLKELNQAYYHLNEAITLASAQGDVNDYLLCYRLRGDMYFRMKNYQAAVNDYQILIDILETARSQLVRAFEKTSLLGRYADVYTDLVEAFLRIASLEPKDSTLFLKEAFEYAELAKARILTEQLEEKFPPGTPQNIKVKIRTAQKKVQKKQLQFQTLGPIGAQTDSIKKWESAWEEIYLAEQVLDQCYKELPEQKDISQPLIPDFDRLNQLMPQDIPTVILEFNLSTRALGIIWVSNVSGLENMGFLIEGSGYGQFQQLREKYICNDIDLPKLIHSLQDLLLNKLVNEKETLLQILNNAEIERIVLIPHGVLHQLPLHVAICQAYKTSENIQISYAPSVTILLELNQQLLKKPTAPLIMANPTSDLPGAEKEGVEISEIYPKAKLFNGQSASKFSLMKHLSAAHWVHLGCHAITDWKNPLDSCLMMADDEKLKVRDILEQDQMPHSATIVLSACESGGIPEDPSGEYVGLPGAFLSLGAVRVIASLWPVHDIATAWLMKRFYQNLEDDQPLSIALINAQKTLRGTSWEKIESDIKLVSKADRNRIRQIHWKSKKGETAPPNPDHPIIWAPFFITGAAWQSKLKWSGKYSDLGPKKANEHLLKGLGKSGELQLHLDRADRLENQGQADLAMEILMEAQKNWPQTIAIFDRLGDLYAKKGNFNLAVQYFEKALKLDANNFVVQYNLACTYRDWGFKIVDIDKIRQARSEFNKVLRLNPFHSNTYCNFAEIHNQPEIVVSYLTEASKISPDDREITKVLGLWEGFLKENADMVDQRLAWASKAFKSKDFSLSREHITMTKMEELDKVQLAKCFRIESDILREEGRLQQSIEKLETATNVNPNRPEYWNTLGARITIYSTYKVLNPELQKDLFKKAEKAFIKAISVGDYAKPRLGLAMLYMRHIVNHSKAQEELNVARKFIKAQLNRTNPETLACEGCPTLGKDPVECKRCNQEVNELQADLTYPKNALKQKQLFSSEKPKEFITAYDLERKLSHLKEQVQAKANVAQFELRLDIEKEVAKIAETCQLINKKHQMADFSDIALFLLSYPPELAFFMANLFSSYEARIGFQPYGTIMMAISHIDSLYQKQMYIYRLNRLRENPQIFELINSRQLKINRAAKMLAIAIIVSSAGVNDARNFFASMSIDLVIKEKLIHTLSTYDNGLAKAIVFRQA